MDPTDSDVTDPISDPFTDDDEPVISYGNELAENKPKLSPLAGMRPSNTLPRGPTLPQSSFNWASDDNPSPFGRAPAINLESDEEDGFNIAPVLAPVKPRAGLVHSRSGVYDGYGDFAADVEDCSEIETESIPSDPVIPADNLSTDPTSEDSDSAADVDSILEDDSMIAELEDVKARDQFIQSSFGGFGKNDLAASDSGAFISGAPVTPEYPFTVEKSMFDDDFVVQSDPVIKETPPEIPNMDNFVTFNDPFVKDPSETAAAAFALDCLNLGNEDEPGTENFEVFIDDDSYSEPLGTPNTDAYAFTVKGNPVIGGENDPFGDGNFIDSLVVADGANYDAFGGVNLSENDPFGDDLRAVDDKPVNHGDKRFDYHTETSYDTAIQNHPHSSTSSSSDKLENAGVLLNQDNVGTECFEVVIDEPLIDIGTNGNIFSEKDLVDKESDSPNIVITVDEPIDICAPVPDNNLEKPTIWVVLMDKTKQKVTAGRQPDLVSALELRDAVCRKLRMTAEGAQAFSIWLCSPYLQVQLKPIHYPTALADLWQDLLAQFAAVRENECTSDLPIIMLMRNCFYPLAKEKELVQRDTQARYYLTAEAVFNIKTARYPIEEDLAYKLAAIQLKMGGKKVADFEPGSIQNIAHEVLPWDVLRKKKKQPLYIDKQIRSHLADLKSTLPGTLDTMYLNHAWTQACYRCAFFQGQTELSGKRKDVLVTVGITPHNIFIWNKNTNKLLQLIPVKDISSVKFYQKTIAEIDNADVSTQTILAKEQTANSNKMTFDVFVINFTVIKTLKSKASRAIPIYSKQASMMNAMFQRCRNEAALHKDFINSTINPARMDEVDAAIHNVENLQFPTLKVGNKMVAVPTKHISKKENIRGLTINNKGQLKKAVIKQTARSKYQV